MGRKIQGFKVKVSALPHLPLPVDEFKIVDHYNMCTLRCFIYAYLCMLISEASKNKKYKKNCI